MIKHYTIAKFALEILCDKKMIIKRERERGGGWPVVVGPPPNPCIPILFFWIWLPVQKV